MISKCYVNLFKTSLIFYLEKVFIDSFRDSVPWPES